MDKKFLQSNNNNNNEADGCLEDTILLAAIWVSILIGFFIGC